MKVKLLIAVLLVLGLAIFGMSYRRTSASRQSPQIDYVVSSPNDLYKVTIVGKPGKPQWPFDGPSDVNNREVKVDVIGRGEPLLQDYIIYSGDAYDSDFSLLYPEHKWLSDSVLHFGRDLKTPDRDEIYVINQSQQTLRYLYVKAGKTNIFLLFDLAPKSVNKLTAHLDYWERVVGAEGRFQDGTSLSYRDVVFSGQDGTQSQAHYCVIVTDRETTIQSREFEGKQTMDRTPVPKAECLF